ncbi:hypothetical protein [Zobellella denitrificans]
MARIPRTKMAERLTALEQKAEQMLLERNPERRLITFGSPTNLSEASDLLEYYCAKHGLDIHDHEAIEAHAKNDPEAPPFVFEYVGACFTLLSLLDGPDDDQQG